MKNIKEIAELRRTTKHFLDKKIPQETLDYIMATATLAPSSIGLDSTRYIIIRSKEAKADFMESFEYNKSKMINISDWVLFITRTDDSMRKENGWLDKELSSHLIKKYGNTDSTKGLTKTMTSYVQDYNLHHANAHYVTDKSQSITDWLAKQAYIQLGFMMLAAEEQGVNSVPAEGFNYKEIREVLIKRGLMAEDEFVSVSLGLGYRNNEAEFNGISGDSVRPDLSDKVKMI